MKKCTRCEQSYPEDEYFKKTLPSGKTLNFAECHVCRTGELPEGTTYAEEVKEEPGHFSLGYYPDEVIGPGNDPELKYLKFLETPPVNMVQEFPPEPELPPALTCTHYSPYKTCDDCHEAMNTEEFLTVRYGRVALKTTCQSCSGGEHDTLECPKCGTAKKLDDFVVATPTSVTVHVQCVECVQGV